MNLNQLKLMQYMNEKLKILYGKSFKYLYIVGLPISIGLYLLAGRIIFLLYGQAYSGAVIALQVISWYLFIKFLNFLLGTVLSLISRSGVYPEGTLLVALAYTLGGDLHVSSRFCGRGKAVDLKELLDRVISLVGGEVGGHSLAAGAHVKADKEEELLRTLDKVFSETLSAPEASLS